MLVLSISNARHIVGRTVVRAVKVPAVVAEASRVSSLQPDRSPATGRRRRRLSTVCQELAGALVEAAAGPRDPVALGRALLLATGLVVSATAPLLAPDRHTWLVLMLLTAAMGGLLVVSLWLPWSRVPAGLTLAFPVLVLGALGLLGLSTRGVAAPYVGLLVLCFTYTGLTQPVAASLWLVPPAAAAYVAAIGTWSAAVGVRLAIVVTVWVLVSQVLADLMQRQRELTDALHRAAQTDALTGLGNRRALDLRLSLADPGDSVVICDLDHFKRLNDTAGHAAGDRVLADFGLVLKTGLRATDYAARYGGEEFAMVLSSSSLHQAALTVARLRAHWMTLHPEVTFSAGFAAIVEGSAGFAALAAADEALYEAKAAGRNCDRRAGAAREQPPQPTLESDLATVVNGYFER